MKFITLKHSNLQEDVMIVADTVCAFYYNRASLSTHVMVNGGGMFPVKESVEQIKEKLLNATSYGSIAKVVDIKTKQSVVANVTANPSPKEDTNDNQR